MRQRAEEVGGRFVLRSGAEGTSVEVALPMSAS
jgi:signal transduction histidine kinase